MNEQKKAELIQDLIINDKKKFQKPVKYFKDKYKVSYDFAIKCYTEANKIIQRSKTNEKL